jgi:hypothetical protein
MLPMTVAEVTALARKNDRELDIDIHSESPFQLKCYPSYERFPVTITDLPAIRDLPTADAARAQAAYNAVRELTYKYLRLLMAHEESWDAQRERDTLVEVLRLTMTPKPFYAAILAVNADIEGMRTGILSWLKHRNAA